MAEAGFSPDSIQAAIRCVGAALPLPIKVKIKVSGCFRTRLHAEIWCRISSYLTSMAARGHNPLVAIQIALAGNAADIIKMHNAKPASADG